MKNPFRIKPYLTEEEKTSLPRDKQKELLEERYDFRNNRNAIISLPLILATGLPLMFGSSYFKNLPNNVPIPEEVRPYQDAQKTLDILEDRLANQNLAVDLPYVNNELIKIFNESNKRNQLVRAIASTEHDIMEIETKIGPQLEKYHLDVDSAEKVQLYGGLGVITLFGLVGLGTVGRQRALRKKYHSERREIIDSQ